MRDDGIGVRVAEAIKDDLTKEDIKTVIAETDFEYALFEVQGEDYVIVLDAITTGKKPGGLLLLSLEKAAALQQKQFSQHELKLIDLIYIGNKDIKGYFIGIEAAEIGFGMELSTELTKIFGSICNKVKKRILMYNKDYRIHDTLFLSSDRAYLNKAKKTAHK